MVSRLQSTPVRHDDPPTIRGGILGLRKVLPQFIPTSITRLAVGSNFFIRAIHKLGDRELRAILSKPGGVNAGAATAAVSCEWVGQWREPQAQVVGPDA
ncbi:hypothetical protein J6590_008702 [Homalodisca vitripennis]|nr:hypothetical protein J6590_008702 [Homalodisca vitripennis]